MIAWRQLEENQHKNEKSNSKIRVTGRRSSKKGITKRMLKENEELIVEQDEPLQEEFDESRKLTMWLSVIAISLGIITTIAAVTPKNNVSAKAIKYDLNCLTETIESPLKDCKLKERYQ